jgi:chemotaxis protein MotB
MRLISTCTLMSLCALLTLSGCASDQALRGSLAERDGMIRRLRDENATLQQEIVHLAEDRAGLQSDLRDLRDRQVPLETIPAALPTIEAEELAEYGIEVERRGDEIIYLVPSAITFGAGKAELTPAGERALKALAPRMASDTPGAAVISVEGHTDSDPIRRSGFASNRELSLARALAVHGFLVSLGDLPDERFVVMGYGPHRPLQPNSDASGKARNRRVEIIVRARRR